MAVVLIVSTILQPPINTGSKSCIYNYCELLKRQGHELYYMYLGHAPEKEIELARNYWGKHLLYYKYSFFLRGANWIHRRLNHNFIRQKYDIGYLCPVWGAGHFMKKFIRNNNVDYVLFNYVWLSPIFKFAGQKKKIIFTHDCFSNKAERIHQDKYSLSPDQESRALKKADIVLAIQEHEAHAFEILAPNKPIYTVYMPVKYIHLPQVNNKNILFISGDSDLNRNGINRFIKNVFYHLIKTDDNINLIIGGGISSFISKTYNHRQIKIIGNVSNLSDFYLLGDIVINPIYQGTGLKIKTLEAISFGKIVIVNPHSIEGLYKSDIAPVIVAEDDNKYVNILKLALDGEIDLSMQKAACEKYINQMNDFINRQYREIIK